MPIQTPQWTDFLSCPICFNEFDKTVRLPKSLSCGHTLCQSCLQHLHRNQCPFDQAAITLDTQILPINYALLQLTGVDFPEPYPLPDIPELQEFSSQYEEARGCIEDLASYLKPLSTLGTSTSISNGCPSAINGNTGNLTSIMGNILTRPMQRKLVTLVNCQLVEEEGRIRAMRAARSLGERTVTELLLLHQNQNQVSANLWAAVRARGCQFLGPAMQEEALKLILIALETGESLSRKVLVLYVVQKLETMFPQASKTSIGHVVQLLYRASCFKVFKRDEDSSLMQLKEQYRTYDALRREHDSQIVHIAMEAGLRINPEQWSSLLYGDQSHKSHMQSIIDKLQTPASFSSSIQELTIALQRTGDPGDLGALRLHFETLSEIDASPSTSVDAKDLSWDELEQAMKAVRSVVNGFVEFTQTHGCKMKGTAEQQQVQSGKYKTSMCRDMLQRNICPRRSSCTFAHTEDELEKNRRRARTMRFNGSNGVVARGSSSNGEMGFIPSDEESNSSGQSRGGSQRSSPQSVGVNGTMDDQIGYGSPQYRRSDQQMLLQQTTARFQDLNIQPGYPQGEASYSFSSPAYDSAGQQHFCQSSPYGAVYSGTSAAAGTRVPVHPVLDRKGSGGNMTHSPTRNSPTTVQENSLAARGRSGSEGYDVPTRRYDERPMMWNGTNPPYSIMPVQTGPPRDIYGSASELYIPPGQTVNQQRISNGYNSYCGVPYQMHPSPRIDYASEYYPTHPMQYTPYQCQSYHQSYPDPEMQYAPFRSRAPYIPGEDALAGDMKNDTSPIGSDGDVTDGAKDNQGLGGLSIYIRDHQRKPQDVYSRAHLNSSSSSGISSSSSAGGHSSPNSHSPASLSPRQPSPIGWNSSSDSIDLRSSMLRDLGTEDKHFPSMPKICGKTGKPEEQIWTPTNSKGLDWPAVGSERWERDCWAKQDQEKGDQWNSKHQGLLMQGFPAYGPIRTDQWADPELQRRVEQERKDAQLARELHKEEQLKSSKQTVEAENLANDEAMARELQKKYQREEIKLPVKLKEESRTITPEDADYELQTRKLEQTVAERKAFMKQQQNRDLERIVEERRKMIEKQNENKLALNMDELHRNIQLRKRLMGKQTNGGDNTILSPLKYPAPSAIGNGTQHNGFHNNAFDSNGTSSDFQRVNVFSAFGGKNAFQPLKCASSVLGEDEDKLSKNIAVQE